jgi:small-conductance mechanosensitive channel
VHQLNTRSTVLMSQSGNHVQIPNATVFKSTIRNFTSNPNRREEFVIGIGYEDRIAHAQEIALRVLAAHPAVLESPEPWVLVDRLGSATVDLKVYFWLDGSVHHYAKVRSALMRLIKRAFQDAGISMPDPHISACIARASREPMASTSSEVLLPVGAYYILTHRRTIPDLFVLTGFVVATPVGLVIAGNDMANGSPSSPISIPHPIR